MYCRRCKYDIRSLGRGGCPECGCRFDPDDPLSYLHSRHEEYEDRIAYLVFSILISLILPTALVVVVVACFLIANLLVA